MQAIPLVVAIILCTFWAWMFWDFMNHSYYEFHYSERLLWLAAFIAFNILTAGYYFVTVYAERRR